MNRRAKLTALLATCAVLALLPAVAAAACPKTSLPAIEDEVMCPICGVPLANAGGPQAENEREFIRNRVDECKSKRQIKAALVAEYGDEVLAMPGHSGFGLAAYLVPVGGLSLAALALTAGAVRWRRARDAAPGRGTNAVAGDGPGDGPSDGPSDEPAETALETDLRKYDL